MSSIQSALQKAYFKTPYPVRWFAGSIFRQLPEWLTYGKQYAKVRKFLAGSDQWSKKEVQEFQLSKLHEIIEYAYKHVPFYQRLWKEHGFEPSMFTSLKDMRKIPCITKELIQERIAEFTTTDKDELATTELGSTGGTSGRQFEFLINKSRLGIEQAFRMDQWARFGFNPGSARAVFRGVVDFKNDRGQVYVHEPILNEYRFNVFKMAPSTFTKYVDALNKIKAPFLYGYPSAIGYLAQHYVKNSIAPPPGLRGVILVSEKPYDHHIETIKKAFKVRCVSFYGMSEKVSMGAECEFSSDYHYYPQYGYTEFITPAGKVAKLGHRAEIVGTSFVATAVPFIRYRTGDATIYKGTSCTHCKRNHPISGPVEGRWGKDILVGKNGSPFTNTALNMHAEVMANIERYQYFQDTKGQAKILIIKGPDFSKEDELRILKAYSAKGGTELFFSIKYVDKLMQSSIGKIPMVMTKLKKSDMPDV
jgi:phenylacetate-CoA ligase